MWLVIGPVSFFFALTLVLLPAAPLVLVAPLILRFVYKDRSPKVRFYAAQSFWYQVAWVVVSFVLGIIGFVLTLLSLGLALVSLLPLGLAVGLIPFAHQCYAAYKVDQGADYRYPLIADLVDGGHRFG